MSQPPQGNLPSLFFDAPSLPQHSVDHPSLSFPSRRPRPPLQPPPPPSITPLPPLLHHPVLPLSRPCKAVEEPFQPYLLLQVILRSSKSSSRCPSFIFSPFLRSRNSRAQQIADLRFPLLLLRLSLDPGWNRTITEEQYGKLSDVTMDKLHDSLEELVEGVDGAEGGWEVEYSVSFSPSYFVLF